MGGGEGGDDGDATAKIQRGSAESFAVELSVAVDFEAVKKSCVCGERRPLREGAKPVRAQSCKDYAMTLMNVALYMICVCLQRKRADKQDSLEESKKGIHLSKSHNIEHTNKSA